MPDVTITVVGGPLNESFTIPDADVERMIPMVARFYPDGDNLVDSFLKGIWNHLVADLFKYDQWESRLRRKDWTPPGGEPESP
ncbi:hypothetical protein DRQ32_04145 [bacterium]|nr:MAG: hypothetical protein DRQ32_04145 [bacterium]RLE26504.1 MAG: hypothetical protein DRJ50_00745 [Actinomycetota bacterium]